jgi:hypothetical protein
MPFSLDPLFRGGSSSSGSYSIGWQDWAASKGGPGFVTIRRGAMGLLKVVNRYPLTDTGWAQAWQEFITLDPTAAERVRDVLARRPGEPAAPEPEPKREVAAAKREPLSVRLANTFTGLGVRVSNGEVYPYPTFGKTPLGPIKGARAEITDPTKAQMIRAGVLSGITLGALIGPLALAPGVLRKSKAVAFVICPNGKLHEKKLNGTAMIRAAQRDAMKFNTLAGPVEAPAPVAPQSPPPTPRERLTEVTRLHDEGLLTDEEYQAKRAEIIRQL